MRAAPENQGVVYSDVTGSAVDCTGDPVRLSGAVIRPCRRYAWSDLLHTTILAGFGHRAVFRDGQLGPIRSTYAAARRDARNGVTAPPREDVSAREGTGS